MNISKETFGFSVIALLVGCSSVWNASAAEPSKKAAVTKTIKSAATTPQGQAEEIIADLLDGTNFRSSLPAPFVRAPLPQDSIASARLRGAYAQMEVRRQFQSVSPDLRNSCVSKLQALGPTIAPFLAGQLNSPSSAVISVCAEVLGKFGSDAIEPLMQQLREHGPSQNIEQAIRQVGEDAMPPLIKMLQNSQDSQRLTAAEVINYLVPMNAQDSNFSFQQNSGGFLLSSKLVDAICAATLSEKSVKIRQLETQILGKLGSRQGVVEALSKLAESDEEPLVRGKAIFSIGTIAAKESEQTAGPYIAKLVGFAKNDEFDGCRIAAINAIGQAKKAPEVAVPALSTMLNNKRSEISNAALTNLSKFGDQATSALPALMKIVEQNGDSQQSYLALQTIGHLGVNAKPAVDLLVKNISSSDSSLRRGALSALRSLARDGDMDLKPYIPKLSDLLNSDDFSARWEVIQTLEAMGPQAASAKESLIEVMEKYPQDKSRVQMALKRILGTIP